jgi:hypothetical protein
MKVLEPIITLMCLTYLNTSLLVSWFKKYAPSAKRRIRKIDRAIFKMAYKHDDIYLLPRWQNTMIHVTSGLFNHCSVNRNTLEDRGGKGSFLQALCKQFPDSLPYWIVFFHCTVDHCLTVSCENHFQSYTAEVTKAVQAGFDPPRKLRSQVGASHPTGSYEMHCMLYSSSYRLGCPVGRGTMVWFATTKLNIWDVWRVPNP